MQGSGAKRQALHSDQDTELPCNADQMLVVQLVNKCNSRDGAPQYSIAPQRFNCAHMKQVHQAMHCALVTVCNTMSG